MILLTSLSFTEYIKNIKKNKFDKKILKLFENHLYTAGLVPPDLLIRTSGEMRLSNFLLWQMAYAEIYVTNTLWPDFDRKEFHQALFAYQQRERRFGKVGE